MAVGSIHRVIVVVVTGAALLAIASWGGLLEGPPTASAPRDRVPVLDERAALELLPRLASNDKIEFDPVAIVRPRAGYSMEFDWPEHEDGRFLMQTNAQGFREDGPVASHFDGTRILVLGDSHPFGLVNNKESLANVLEARLATRPDGPYDVVNAAVSGTGPYEYLGALKKHLALEPDVVVAVLFTGNDFRNALRFADWFAGRERTPSPLDPKILADLPKAWLEPMGQGVTQALEFTRRPEDGERALAAALDRFADMADVCASRGIGFLAVTLPTKADVDSLHDREKLDRLLALLDMDLADYDVNHRLGQRFSAALRARGVPVMDVYAAMLATDEPLYWAADHHLDVAGHALVARELEAPVLALLGRT